MKSESVFTLKLQGKVPGEKIYEDTLTFAFLDDNPVSKGHLLVMPKQQYDHIDDCPTDVYHAVYETVRLLTKSLKEIFSPLRVAIVVHGTEVPHAHVHVIPLYTGKELSLADRKPHKALIEALPAVGLQIRNKIGA